MHIDKIAVQTSLLHVQVGGSPTYTLTEDYALGMELVMRQWKCRYVTSYLVVGEAPEQVRNAMQQRSRWVKAGHFHLSSPMKYFLLDFVLRDFPFSKEACKSIEETAVRLCHN